MKEFKYNMKAERCIIAQRQVGGLLAAENTDPLGSRMPKPTLALQGILSIIAGFIQRGIKVPFFIKN